MRQPAPTKSELVTALENGYRRVREAAPQANREALEQPHAVELLKKTNLATVGDVLAHLMSSHFSFHLAQLSACRRGAGKPPIV